MSYSINSNFEGLIIERSLNTGPYITQKKIDTNRLVQYIARKFNIGQDLNDVEARRVDQGADQIVDVRWGFIMLTYGL